eukprot:m51a1_g5668 hypothetical protein (978) ;mRNA; f:919970-924001
MADPSQDADMSSAGSEAEGSRKRQAPTPAAESAAPPGLEGPAAPADAQPSSKRPRVDSPAPAKPDIAEAAGDEAHEGERADKATADQEPKLRKRLSGSAAATQAKHATVRRSAQREAARLLREAPVELPSFTPKQLSMDMFLKKVADRRAAPAKPAAKSAAAPASLAAGGSPTSSRAPFVAKPSPAIARKQALAQASAAPAAAEEPMAPPVAHAADEDEDVIVLLPPQSRHSADSQMQLSTSSTAHKDSDDDGDEAAKTVELGDIDGDNASEKRSAESWRVHQRLVEEQEAEETERLVKKFVWSQRFREQDEEDRTPGRKSARSRLAASQPDLSEVAEPDPSSLDAHEIAALKACSSQADLLPDEDPEHDRKLCERARRRMRLLQMDESGASQSFSESFEDDVLRRIRKTNVSSQGDSQPPDDMSRDGTQSSVAQAVSALRRSTSRPMLTGFVSDRDVALYQNVVLDSNAEQWLNLLDDTVTFATDFLPLTIADAHALLAANEAYERAGRGYPRAELLVTGSLESLASSLQQVIDSVRQRNSCEYVFVKGSSRSHKDVLINCKPLLEVCRRNLERHLKAGEPCDDNTKSAAVLEAGVELLRAREAREVVALLAASTRIKEDMTLALEHPGRFCENIVVRQWVDIDIDMEFRAFVHGGELRAMSQYNHFVVFERLLRVSDAVCSRVREFWQREVRPRLEAGRYPRDYVVDFAVTGAQLDRVWVIEINPFLDSTDPALFSWTNDRKVLTEGPFEFRVRTKKMAGAPPKPNAPDIPPGPYRDSCGGCRIEGDLVICDECTDSRGGKKKAFISVSECESITNSDGFLVCDKAPNQPGIPPGDYTDTCGGCRIDGNLLKCECKDSTGEFRDTQIVVSSCPSGAFANKEGALACGEAKQQQSPTRAPKEDVARAQEPQDWTGLPEGTYRQSCEACKASDPPKTLTCNCKDGDGSLHQTTVYTDRCHHFDNHNGKLVCGDSKEL